RTSSRTRFTNTPSKKYWRQMMGLFQREQSGVIVIGLLLKAVRLPFMKRFLSTKFKRGISFALPLITTPEESFIKLSGGLIRVWFYGERITSMMTNGL